MAKKKLGIASIEVNKKFKSGEEAFLYAKRLREFIRYMCKKNADKGWYAQALIVSSNVKKGVSSLKIKNNGKVGGQRKELEIEDLFANRLYNGNYKTDWHLHILLVSCPSYAFRNVIKNYIDKNWIDVDNNISENNSNNKKVYKKNCNIKLADYFIDQSAKRLFCNYNYGNEEPLKYSLKQYCSEYLKLKNKIRKLNKEQIKSLMTDEEFIEKYNKIESKFKEISEYFYNISKEDDEKKALEFMAMVRRNKIAENYDNIKNDNKVQINSNRIIDDNSPF